MAERGQTTALGPLTRPDRTASTKTISGFVRKQTVQYVDSEALEIGDVVVLLTPVIDAFAMQVERGSTTGNADFQPIGVYTGKGGTGSLSVGQDVSGNNLVSGRQAQNLDYIEVVVWGPVYTRVIGSANADEGDPIVLGSQGRVNGISTTAFNGTGIPTFGIILEDRTGDTSTALSPVFVRFG